MIAMVKGTLMEKSEGEAVVMTAGGLGLRVMCSMNTLAALPAAGQECALYTFMNVREDAMELFGFYQKEERDMFKRLTSVSGIGPKSALGVLGSMPLADLRLAILTGDAAALSRAPGIGKKTAQRGHSERACGRCGHSGNRPPEPRNTPHCQPYAPARARLCADSCGGRDYAGGGPAGHGPIGRG